MSTMLTSLWQLVRAFVLIYACLYAGIAIAALLPITIPGSIIGMLILFVLLAFQILPAKWVQPACNLLIRYISMCCRRSLARWSSPVLSARWWYLWW